MATGISQKFSLYEARANRGQSLQALADDIGIDWRTLKKLEAGEAVWFSKAKIVADFFKVQVTDLMPVDEPKAAA